MIKKAILSVFALVASFAPNCAESYVDICGMNLYPYIGIAGGFDTVVGNFKSSTNLDEFHTNSINGTDGLIGGVIGVQTFICNNVFLALQANFLYNGYEKIGREDENAPRNFKDRHFNDFQGGIDARIGWSICSVSPYIIIGTEAGNWKRSLINRAPTPFRGVPSNGTVSVTKCLWGPKVGLGATFPLLCHCLWANFEYSFVWFGNTTQVIPTPTEIWTHRDKIRQGSVLWGLNYLF